VVVNVTSDRPDTMFGLSEAFGPGPRCFSWPKRKKCGDFDYSQRLCTAPCSVTVSGSEGPYRIVGPHIAASTAFDLPASPRVDLRVRAGSWGGLAVGVTFTSLGAGFAAAGGAELLIWTALGQPPVLNHTPGVLLPQGIVFLSLGVLFLTIGIPVWLTSRTHVDMTPSRTSRLVLRPDGFAF
jgi:hypothetical protein